MDVGRGVDEGLAMCRAVALEGRGKITWPVVVSTVIGRWAIFRCHYTA